MELLPALLAFGWRHRAANRCVRIAYVFVLRKTFLLCPRLAPPFALLALLFGLADLRPSDTASVALENFKSRCAQSGVMICEGFDSGSVFAPSSWPNSGFYYEKDCPTWPTRCIQQDFHVAFSGASSARWDIYRKTGENAEGNWVQRFPQTLGPNSTFYVQYPFRADQNWVSIDWTKTGTYGNNTAPKPSIFHNHVATCAAEEITIHDHNSWGTPTGYTDCGGNQLTTET